MLTRAKPAPFADYNAETCEGVLSEDYKRAIRDAIPSGIKPTDAFWDTLTDIVSKFYILEKCRANQRRAVDEIKRWQKIAKLLAAAKRTDDVKDMVKTAKGKLTGYRLVVGDFKGTKNPNREALYMWVLEDLWCRSLGLQLGISRYADKKRPGPLIKFFAACVNPLLPKPLADNSIVSIVRRAKARRKQFEILNRKAKLKAAAAADPELARKASLPMLVKMHPKKDRM
jgi:hypothetical protein